MADAPEKSPFSGLGGVLAGGYAVVTGALTFLGVKDAALTRLLREEPRSVLFFATLLAAGVILGAAAQFVRIPGSLRAPTILVLCVAPVVAFHQAANEARTHDVVAHPENLTWILGAVLLVAGLLIIRLWPRRLDMNGCFLLFGGVCFALGAYGSVRLAVDTETAFRVAEITEAKVVLPKDEPPRFQATVKASGMLRCQSVAVTVNGIPFTEARGGGDGTATVKVDALIDPAWVQEDPDHLTIAAQVRIPGTSSCETTELQGPVVSQLVSLPVGGVPVLTPSFAKDRTLSVGVVVADQPPTATLRVVVTDRPATDDGCNVLATASLGVDGGGDLQTTVVAPVAADVEHVQVRAELEASGSGAEIASCGDDLPDQVVLTLTPPAVAPTTKAPEDGSGG